MTGYETSRGILGLRAGIGAMGGSTRTSAGLPPQPSWRTSKNRKVARRMRGSLVRRRTGSIRADPIARVEKVRFYPSKPPSSYAPPVAHPKIGEFLLAP